MPSIYDQDADIHFGGVDKPLPNWREFSDDDPDDSELENTPQDVIAVLGFDPKEFSEEDLDGEKGGPGSGPRPGVPRGPYKVKPKSDNAQAEFEKSLTPDEYESIRYYSEYHQNYAAMNGILRGGEGDAETKKNLQHFLELTGRAPKYEGEIYKGLSFGTDDMLSRFVNNVRSSGQIEHQGFSSGSKSIETAERYMQFMGRRDNLLMTIKAKAGVDLSNVGTATKSQQEVVFKPGSVLKLVSESEKNGKIHMLFEEV